jgi:hypothetical protein
VSAVLDRLVTLCAFLAVAGHAVAGSEHILGKPRMVGGNPGPAHNYVCPNADGAPALDCYLDAVRHLYTMCKHVKSIEIIEHGYEKAEEGINSAKSEYCVDKQKGNISRPLQAALREANTSRQAADEVKKLHEFWLSSMASLRWRAGESDDDYKSRTAAVYASFEERMIGIRSMLAASREKPPSTKKVAGAATGNKATR